MSAPPPVEKDDKKKKDKKKNRLQGAGGAKKVKKDKPAVSSSGAVAGSGDSSAWSQNQPDMSEEVEHAAKLKAMQCISNSEPSQVYPTGLCVIKEFITKEEEALLMAFFDAQEWDQETNIGRRTQQWGFSFDYKEMTVLNATRPLPDLLKPLMKRMTSIPEGENEESDHYENFPFGPRTPEQMIVNEYTTGQGIHPHLDRRCFGECIASLSLGGGVMFELDRSGGESGTTTILNDFSKCPTFAQRTELQKNTSAYGKAIFMPPRCLIMMKDEARYRWTHGIPPSTFDDLPTGRETRSRRVSLTFRTLTEESKERIGEEAVDLSAAWKK